MSWIHNKAGDPHHAFMGVCVCGGVNHKLSRRQYHTLAHHHAPFLKSLC